mmetsp:Transcript_17358/g.49624  ORF Transcript_17358/g.49624 Transcript_17358/m.49624 type:complete len:428 (-) Transcript_17358:142-1425(-)
MVQRSQEGHLLKLRAGGGDLALILVGDVANSFAHVKAGERVHDLGHVAHHLAHVVGEGRRARAFGRHKDHLLRLGKRPGHALRDFRQPLHDHLHNGSLAVVLVRFRLGGEHLCLCLALHADDLGLGLAVGTDLVRASLRQEFLGLGPVLLLEELGERLALFLLLLALDDLVSDLEVDLLLDLALARALAHNVLLLASLLDGTGARGLGLRLVDLALERSALELEVAVGLGLHLELLVHANVSLLALDGLGLASVSVVPGHLAARGAFVLRAALGSLALDARCLRDTEAFHVAVLVVDLLHHVRGQLKAEVAEIVVNVLAHQLGELLAVLVQRLHGHGAEDLALVALERLAQRLAHGLLAVAQKVLGREQNLRLVDLGDAAGLVERLHLDLRNRLDGHAHALERLSVARLDLDRHELQRQLAHLLADP